MLLYTAILHVAAQYSKGSILRNKYMIFLVFQCQATNEEEIFEVQDKGSLFTLGWIHVSPIEKMYIVD
jgi:hypothetical protein